MFVYPGWPVYWYKYVIHDKGKPKERVKEKKKEKRRNYDGSYVEYGNYLLFGLWICKRLVIVEKAHSKIAS